MHIKSIILILAIGLFYFPATAQTTNCTLKGVVVDRNSKALLLIKATGDIRKSSIRIPIVNNQFAYTLLEDEMFEMEMYELIFEDEYQKSVYDAIYFFPDNKEVNFTLYPEVSYGKNTIQGGYLNKAYTEYKKQIAFVFDPRLQELSNKRNELKKNNDYDSPAIDSVRMLLKSAKTEDLLMPIYRRLDEMRQSGEDLTANAKILSAEFKAVLSERDEWRYNYIRNNPTLVSYYLMLQDSHIAKNDENIASKLKEVYPYYAAAFPSHTYTKQLENEVAALYMRKRGQKFVDFSAPDMSGKMYTFSNLLNNKVTLLDLWGSWCGPCMATSRTMLPVYAAYKDKGFQVIGVAREFKNTAELKNAMKREKYPWLNLVDLDDKHEVWSKYGIGNGGGCVFLFDKEGKVLAINPTADEVKKLLVDKL